MGRFRTVIEFVLLLAVLLAASCDEPTTDVQPTTTAPVAQETPTPLPQRPTETAVPPAATATPSPPAPAATVTPAPPIPTATATPIPPAPTATAVPETAQFPYTVVDSNGRDITFDKPPERIVVFDSAALETLFAIGEGDRIVGTHDFVSYPPEADDIARLGGAFTMNVEATIALDPDLVFVFFDGFVPDLENAGLEVLYLKSLNSDFRKVSDTIRMWGRITGSTIAAATVAADFDARVVAIEQTMAGQPPGPSIFQDFGELWTPGPDTLVGEVFGLLKLQNIAHEVSGYVQLSPEIIVASDPELIIAYDPASITENDAFKDIKAVKEGRVLKLPSDALDIAGPRYIDGIEELAAIAYPDLFN